METYSFGDWVVYDPGYKEPEIGRVTEDRGDSAFVCYHTGCTASSTYKRSLRPATRAVSASGSCPGRLAWTTARC